MDMQDFLIQMELAEDLAELARIKRENLALVDKIEKKATDMQEDIMMLAAQRDYLLELALQVRNIALDPSLRVEAKAFDEVLSKVYDIEKGEYKRLPRVEQ